MPERNVVTRFAPSPTGALHVGGARTALYSWAFARQHGTGGGRFILRLEDTDRARSTVASARAIIRDLRWLGLDWDEGPDRDAADPFHDQIGEHGPYCQSQRLDLYNEQIEKLLASGAAYEDDGAVRFRMDSDVAFDDAVYGHIEVKQSELEDFVIRKGASGGGFPTFHLAVVVDDALMGVTHVIRGQEHLTNTTKHVALQDALGFDRPTYAHTPSILNPDGSKMSKRDKAKAARAAAKEHDLRARGLPSAGLADDRLQAFLDKQNDDIDIAVAIARELDLDLPEIDIADFRDSGYMPEALLNYLALLGWNPGDDVEKFDLPFIVERFSLDRINKAGSKFDRDKLFRFNADAIAALPFERFTDLLAAHAQAHHPEFIDKLGDANSEQFHAFAASYQPRARTLGEPFAIGRFVVADDDAIEFDEKAVAKVLAKNDGQGVAVLRDLAQRLDEIHPWDAPSIEAFVKRYAEEHSLGLGKVAQPLRVALTGSTVSPSIGETLVLVGKTSAARRIARCLQHCEPA